MRCGAGLVTLGIPRGLINAFIKIKPPEVMLKPLAQTRSLALSSQAYSQARAFLSDADILLLGPGLSQDKSTQGLVNRLIRIVDKPAVVDADAINILSRNPQLLGRHRPAELVITPHPGEMARLLGIGTDEVQADRVACARSLAKESGAWVILKGAGTVVASPEGAALINPTGNPGMASAGMGDALTGVIASLLAQGVPAGEACIAAVYLHGLAGDIASEELGQPAVIASDLIERMGRAMEVASEEDH